MGAIADCVAEKHARLIGPIGGFICGIERGKLLVAPSGLSIDIEMREMMASLFRSCVTFQLPMSRARPACGPF